jgi:hypothetical protein
MKNIKILYVSDASTPEDRSNHQRVTHTIVVCGFTTQSPSRIVLENNFNNGILVEFTGRNLALDDTIALLEGLQHTNQSKTVRTLSAPHTHTQHNVGTTQS